MFGWLCVTLGVAFGSALLPLISVEVWVLGLVSNQPGVHWLAVGAAVAVGQVAGKLLFYLAARGSIRLPAVLHDRLHREHQPSARRDRWRAKTKWLRAKLEALRERCHRHPHWMNGTYWVSAVVGLPPFMATTVLAGLVRMRLSTFLTAGLLGRWVRYSLLAAAPAVFAGWMHL
ncbi:membrane protein [Amycolatopsis nigrescens]|uniref:membrane protein n=1 Tax=Amycolatopsis nigrescens TaxID=381445 RepID=UPI00035CE6AE|nr:membrane protein [Amycolatopsis nigrescens]